MINTNDIADRVATMDRTFNAPRQLVWEAWTQPEHIAAWWGPEGMNTRVQSLDFRPGGSWQYAMTMPNGKDFITSGTFKEIVEFELIVTQADFPPMTIDVTLQVRFEDDGAGTKMTFDVIHNTAEYCEAQKAIGFEKGWGSTFDRLQVFVEGRG